MKKLTKSFSDRKLFGVCGGIGKYLNVDSTVIRLVFIFSVFLGSFGFWLYIICALILPEETDDIID